MLARNDHLLITASTMELLFSLFSQT